MSNTVGRPEDTFHTIEQHAQIACFYCAKKPDQHPLSACSRCSRVSYCNSTCQSSDFRIHKKICKIWNELRLTLHPSSSYPFLSSFPPSANDLNTVMHSMSVEMMGPLMVRLGQKGGMVANYLVFSEPRCQRCLKVGGLGAVQKLEGCEECVVRWCGGGEGECKKEVEKAHKESGLCSKMKEIAGDELVRRAYELSPESQGPGSGPIWSPDRVLRVEIPLPPDWASYLNSVRDPSQFSPALERVFIQHSLSLPLTIVASLQRFGLFSKFSHPKDLKTLTVHLIGAEVKYEITCVGMAYEEILHLLPGVKDLKIVLVGPSLGAEPSDEIPMDCCPLCVRAGRTRSLGLHQTTYHDFLRSRRSSPPADLAIAFNSGCHEDPSNWSPTLSVLLSNRTPTVFTSFNELEAKEDAKVISRKAGAGIEWGWREEKNEWRSGRRHFDLFSGGEEPIWSENGYWLGFRGV